MRRRHRRARTRKTERTRRARGSEEDIARKKLEDARQRHERSVGEFERGFERVRPMLEELLSDPVAFVSTWDGPTDLGEIAKVLDSLQEVAMDVSTYADSVKAMQEYLDSLR